MKSEPELEAELDSLIRGHYYAEDYELRWRLQQFAEALTPSERTGFQRIVLRRLAEEPSILTVLMCQAFPVPQAVPTLIEILDSQTEANMLSRAILVTLGQYRATAAFPVVERFLDSEQEPEALQCLAQLHFDQALFYVIRSARRPHLRDASLHILHERRKQVGLTRLIDDLRSAQLRMKLPVSRRVRDILRHKSGAYSPFSQDEVNAISSSLGGK